MSVEWVFLDAFGTLVYLDHPFERLQAALAAEGHAVPLAAAEHALRQEFAHYIQHSRGASDADALRRLRLECAGVLLAGLHEAGHPVVLPEERAAAVLMAAIEFRLYPDVLPALAALRAHGRRLGLISNWDCSLPEVLHRLGLDPYLEVTVVSALCGSEKPEHGIFARALREAGVLPTAACHVGDSYEKDFMGARAAGMRALLLDREGRAVPPAGVPTAADLLQAAASLP